MEEHITPIVVIIAAAISGVLYMIVKYDQSKERTKEEHLIDLWETVLKAVKKSENFIGLCREINILYEDGIINIHELCSIYNDLEYVKNNKKYIYNIEDKKFFPYFWNPHDRYSRIIFIKKRLKDLRDEVHNF